MERRQLTALSGAALGAIILTPVAAIALPTCAQLATDPANGLAGNPVITSATSVVVPPAGSNLGYCNVQITYSAKSGPADGYAVGQSQAIRIGVGLPLSSADGGTGGVQGAWNGKLENLGGGGLVGNVGSTTSATNAGYVGSSTDGGHTTAENGALGNFGVIQATNTLNVGKINDYIIESVHQQVEWAKQISTTYYGKAATRNYWNGCSTGGRQGFALAQNFGDEFDGFLVGAPAFFHEAFRLSDAWPALVNRDDLVANGLPALTSTKMTQAINSAIAACDVQGTDVVADGIIDDPRACKFSAKANICGAPTAPATNCLTPAEAAAVDKIWDGPRNHLGKRIWYPFDRGAPIGVGFATIPSSAGQVVAWDHADLTFSVNNLYSTRAAASANVLGQPNPIAYEDEALLGARTVNDLTETVSTNLDAVRKRGGKIIMWQGASDQLIRWRDSVDYYRYVATRYGNGKADFAGLQSWFRYYHAPGVQHCGGGVGPSPLTTLPNRNSQLFDDLVKWVEQGFVPSSAGLTTNGGILATGGSGNPTRTRPICPWPTTAIYIGTGSTDVASNFHCSGDLDANPEALCTMLRAKYKHENEGAVDTSDSAIPAGQCNAAVIAKE